MVALIFLDNENKAAVSNQAETTKEFIGKNFSKINKDVSKGNKEFAFSIMKKIIETSKTENMIISPSSISTVLAMVYNGAEGTTKDEMSSALYFEGIDMQSINEGFAYLIHQLNNRNNVVEICNSIWLKTGFPIKDEYKEVIASTLIPM